VLVTGGAGFIGRAVCGELECQGHEPVVFDRHRHSLHDYPVMLGDVRDATAVTEAVAHAEGVIHLAAVLGTQETVANPLPAADTNVLGGLNVLGACGQYGVPLVNIAVGNWFEQNTYAITKTAVERFVLMNAIHCGLPQTNVRAFNAYGPGQAVSVPYGPSKVRKIIPSFTTRALHGDPIEVYGDGSQVMDMIWAGDVAVVLVAALGYTVMGGGAPVTLQAGSGGSTTVLEIAMMVRDEVAAQGGPKVPVSHLAMRPGESPGGVVRADMADTERLLGIRPASFMPLREGIERTVRAYWSETV
jgi:UDP-glucose 4-epimerase